MRADLLDEPRPRRRSYPISRETCQTSCLVSALMLGWLPMAMEAVARETPARSATSLSLADRLTVVLVGKINSLEFGNLN